MSVVTWGRGIVGGSRKAFWWRSITVMGTSTALLTTGRPCGAYHFLMQIAHLLSILVEHSARRASSLGRKRKSKSGTYSS
jgi:hypothetical protein